MVKKQDIQPKRQFTVRHKIFDYLEVVASSIPVNIYWLDVNDVVVGCNEYALRAVGGLFFTEVVGRSLYELYSPEIAEKISLHNIEVIKTGKSLAQEESIQDISTGKIRYFSAFKAPLYGDDGEIVGTLGTSIEITAKKEAERLQLENERQQIILQEREEFRKIVGQAVHDIGSPLTSLGIMLEIGLDLPEEDRNTLRA